MAISKDQEEQIFSLLSVKIDAKLRKYSRESKAMPFLTRLMQDNEKVAAYSFIHSLATTLGMSIYEQTAKILAEPNCEICQTGYDVGGVLSKEQKSVIGNIVRELRNGERNCSIIARYMRRNPKYFVAIQEMENRKKMGKKRIFT